MDYSRGNDAELLGGRQPPQQSRAAQRRYLASLGRHRQRHTKGLSHPVSVSPRTATASASARAACCQVIENEHRSQRHTSHANEHANGTPHRSHHGTHNATYSRVGTSTPPANTTSSSTRPAHRSTMRIRRRHPSRLSSLPLRQRPRPHIPSDQRIPTRTQTLRAPISSKDPGHEPPQRKERPLLSIHRNLLRTGHRHAHHSKQTHGQNPAHPSEHTPRPHAARRGLPAGLRSARCPGEQRACARASCDARARCACATRLRSLSLRA